MTRRAIAAALVSVTLLVACGGDDDRAETADGTADASADSAESALAPTLAPTTPAPTEAPTTPAPTVAYTFPPTTDSEPVTLQGIAQAHVMTSADVPEGWTEEEYDPATDGEGDETAALIAECADVDATLLSDDVLGETEGHSSTFSDPTGAAGVEHIMGFAADEATALAAIAAIGAPEVEQCYVPALTQQLEQAIADGELPPTTTITELSVARVDASDVFADDEAVWYTVVLGLEVDGELLMLYNDLLFLRDGRVLSQLEANGLGEPFPKVDLDAVIGLALTRAGEAKSAAEAAGL